MKNKDVLFGIFHTAHEKSNDFFYEILKDDYINTMIVESPYQSEEFEKSMDEVKKQDRIKVWLSACYLGFSIKNETTITDNGEASSFNPTTSLYDDFRLRIDQFILYLKEKGYYDHILGFYMDEPMLWNITNDMLEEFTGYFRTKAAKDKRFFICFSVAGVAPDVWTLNQVAPITPKSSQYLTDIAFDMYHNWNPSYEVVLKEMLERSGNRDDLKIWMIPCTMNYRGIHKEEDALNHLERCYAILKFLPNPGGLMCYTYYTFKAEEEDLNNIGLDTLSDPTTPHYWPKLVQRVKEIGKEIVRGK